MKKILALALLVFFAGLPILRAAELEPQGTKWRKLQRGAANVALAPLDLVYSMVRYRAEETIPPGWIYGIFYGTLGTVERLGVGIYEIVTFPLEVPKNYKPILTPEFEWERFV